MQHSATGDGPGDVGSVLAAISDRVVRLHKELAGRGPTKAKTYYQDDLVTVVLRGGFTRAEETLFKAGDAETVITQRTHWQNAVKDDFVAAVTELTGREVVAFMSTTHHDPDLSVEVFLLEQDGAAP